MRDPFIDNAKGVLITLVVLGHYLEAISGWKNPYLSAGLSIIYLFHMPAFVFLAGVTAKRERLGMRVANIAIILILFQLAYGIPIILISGEWPTGLSQPYWILWFLLSLIWWMLLIPLIVRVPYAFTISIVTAILGGLYPGDGYQLSIMRTLTFLPFFVWGTLHGNRTIAALQACAWRRLLAIALFATTAAILIFSGLGHRWLYGSFSYAHMGVGDAPGMMIRAALLILSSASLVAFLGCMTTKRSYLSVVGHNSLAIFVLHGFAIIIFENMIVRTALPELPWSFILVVLASLMTTLILAHPFFNTSIRAVAINLSSLFLKTTSRTNS
ncbi:acyltransferase family protein [Yoonia maritima]|uniref:acyltransferase family protein n=1 Tax=Yoonia maritima TaxID=1435347 RepID=UPI003736512B